MKNKLFLSLAIVAVIVFSVLFFALTENREQSIIKFVKENQAELNKIAFQCINGEETDDVYLKVRVDGVFYGEHNMVQFLYSAVGIAPSSKYCGFYYSEDDVPLPFQNCGISLTQTSENEWTWTDGTDNGGVTRKIMDNWFYYEARF